MSRSRSKKISEWLPEEISTPKLSVFMWVFNDENFLRESIDSILEQETDFGVEIVIHDDASKDGSQNILLEYQKKFPHLFKLILQKENQYTKGVDLLNVVWENCNCKYLALTHGDDYWTDPEKLQIQHDLLESDLKAVGVCHSTIIIDHHRKHIRDHIIDKEQFALTDLLTSNPIMTASVLFRRTAITIRDPAFAELQLGDWPIWLQLAKKGYFINLKRIMSAYRVHSGGFWSGATSEHRTKTVSHLKICAAIMVPPEYRLFAVAQLSADLAKNEDSLWLIAALKSEPHIQRSIRVLQELLNPKELTHFRDTWINNLVFNRIERAPIRRAMFRFQECLSAMSEFDSVFDKSTKPKMETIKTLLKTMQSRLKCNYKIRAWREFLKLSINYSLLNAKQCALTLCGI